MNIDQMLDEMEARVGYFDAHHFEAIQEKLKSLAQSARGLFLAKSSSCAFTA